MACYVRPMHQEDITQADEIDREAFPTQWPPTNYHHELKNSLARYVVVCDVKKIPDDPKTEAASEKSHHGLISRMRQLFSPKRSSNSTISPPAREHIVGIAGIWMMAGEAHITTIAVRPAYQRRGIGEQLIISLIDLAQKLNASILTLEVRASNIAAQSLYSKYGFAGVGLRRGYYTDNREDAILMSTEAIASATFQARFQQLKQAHSRKRETLR